MTLDWLKRLGRKATISYRGIFGAMPWQQYLMVNICSPISQMLCFTLVAAYAFKSKDLSPWLIGNALVLTYYNAIFGIGSQLNQEKNAGTLILLVASPANRLGIFLPRAILHIFDGLITVLIGFLVGYLCFGFRMPLVQIPALLLVLLAASFSAMAFGLIISCISLLTRDLNLILNLAAMALLGLTGANFPLSYLPAWLVTITHAMPLTRSIQLARLLQTGEPLSAHLNLLLGEFAVGVVLIVIGTLLFSAMERLAIRRGVLELV